MTPSVRYAAIEPCNMPSGGCTYLFSLEVTHPGADAVIVHQRCDPPLGLKLSFARPGNPRLLGLTRRRFRTATDSAFRAAALAVQAKHPLKAAELPAFPQKHSMRRQTPSFLVTRGRALARYVQALLADRTLAAVPEVQALLTDARPTTEELTPGSPRSPLSQARATMQAVGSPQSSSFSSPATMIASPPMRSPPLPTQPLVATASSDTSSAVVAQPQLQAIGRFRAVSTPPSLSLAPPCRRKEPGCPLSAGTMSPVAHCQLAR